MDIYKKVIGIFLCILVIYLPAYPFTDQTTTERILKENRHFINFVNVCITNFAEDKKEDFMKVYERHFNADVAYLQSDYRRAFKRIYSSQGEMVKLYKNILKNKYLEDSKNILDKIAPMIIRSRNSKARLYLTLGYRDRTISWTHYTIGEASNPKFLSSKLSKFEEAIKMTRRAKRYGFLALFQSQNFEMKRKIYNQLIKNEKDAGNLFYNRFLDKTGDTFIEELGKYYQEYDKAPKERGETDPEAKGVGAFEKQLEKRVRFKKEKMVAEYLMNIEFDKAEDIIRKYITDFNYKIILATFDTLTLQNKELKQSEELIDYSQYKIHLLDNYLRLSKESVLDSLMDKVKVEYDISKEEVETEIRAKKSAEVDKESKTDGVSKTDEKVDSKSDNSVKKLSDSEKKSDDK